MTRSLIIRSALPLLLFAMACSSSSDTSPTVSYRGDLKGRITIYTANASVPSEDILIVLDSGSSSTKTDSAGYWSLRGVPIGTHVISESKVGYGKAQLFNVQVALNGLTWVPLPSVIQPNLYALPTGTVTVDSLRVDTSQDSVYGTLWSYYSSDSQSSCAEFLDTSADVQPAEPHLIAWHTSMVPKGQGYNIHSFAEVHALGVNSGATLYYSICKISVGGEDDGIFYDPVHDQYRIVSPGPKSNVVHLTMR